MERQSVGLDVSKAWLDGYLPANRRRLRVGNDAQGMTELVQALGDPAGCLMAPEASGGCERTAHRALAARDALAAIVDPSGAARSLRLRSSRRRGAGGRVRGFARDFARGMAAAWAGRPGLTASTPG